MTKAAGKKTSHRAARTPAEDEDAPEALDPETTDSLRAKFAVVESSSANHTSIPMPIGNSEYVQDGSVLLMELTRQALIKAQVAPQKIDFKNARQVAFRLIAERIHSKQRPPHKSIARAPCYALDAATGQTSPVRVDLHVALLYHDNNGEATLIQEYRDALQKVRDRHRPDRGKRAASSAQTCEATPTYQAAAPDGTAQHSHADMSAQTGSAAASTATAVPALAPTASADAPPSELHSGRKILSTSVDMMDLPFGDQVPQSVLGTGDTRIERKMDLRVPARPEECLEFLQRLGVEDVIFRWRATEATKSKSGFVDVKAEHLLRLRLKEWLSDDIINPFTVLLQERDKGYRRIKAAAPRCLFFNSFFLEKLGPEAERMDHWRELTPDYLLTKDLLVLPLNTPGHWSVVVVDLRTQRLLHCNSFPDKDREVLDRVASWLQQEYNSKTQKNVNVAEWKRVFPKTLPKQTNAHDCGVFTLMYMHAISSPDVKQGLTWDEKSMPDLRQYILFALLSTRLDLPGEAGKGESFLRGVSEKAATERGATADWDLAGARWDMANAHGDADSGEPVGGETGSSSQAGDQPQASPAQPVSQQSSAQQAQGQPQGQPGSGMAGAALATDNSKPATGAASGAADEATCGAGGAASAAAGGATSAAAGGASSAAAGGAASVATSGAKNREKCVAAIGAASGELQSESEDLGDENHAQPDDDSDDDDTESVVDEDEESEEGEEEEEEEEVMRSGGQLRQGQRNTSGKGSSKKPKRKQAKASTQATPDRPAKKFKCGQAPAPGPKLKLSARPAAQLTPPVINGADLRAALLVNRLIEKVGFAVVRIKPMQGIIEDKAVQEDVTSIGEWMYKHADYVFHHTQLNAEAENMWSWVSSQRRLWVTKRKAAAGMVAAGTVAAGAGSAEVAAGAAEAAGAAKGGKGGPENNDAKEQGKEHDASASILRTPGRPGHTWKVQKPDATLEEKFEGLLQQLATEVNSAAAMGGRQVNPRTKCMLSFGYGTSSIGHQQLHLDQAALKQEQCQAGLSRPAEPPVSVFVPLQGDAPILLVPQSHHWVQMLVEWGADGGDQAQADADEQVSRLMAEAGISLTGKLLVVPQGHMLIMHGNLIHQGAEAHPAWGIAPRAHFTASMPLQAGQQAYPEYADTTFTPGNLAPGFFTPQFAKLFEVEAGLKDRLASLGHAFERAERGVGGGEGTLGHYGTLTNDDTILIFRGIPDFSTKSVLVDMGSGLCKPQLIAAVLYGVKYSVGVEIDPVKCDKAVSFVKRVAAAQSPMDVADLRVLFGSAADFNTLEPATHLYLCWAGWSLKDKDAVGELVKSSHTISYIVVVEHSHTRLFPDATSDDAALRCFPEMQLHNQRDVQMSGSSDTLVAYTFKVKRESVSLQVWPPSGGLLEIKPHIPTTGRPKRKA